MGIVGKTYLLKFFDDFWVFHRKSHFSQSHTKIK
nr:MAG TPA: hypothetical protein [Caudoviricetes sp.]